MNERVVKLGSSEFPIGLFNLGQVSQIAVLLMGLEVVDTQPKAQARDTVIYIGLKAGGYSGSYEDFRNLSGITAPQLMQAQLEVGRAIGYYSEAAGASDEIQNSLPVAA